MQAAGDAHFEEISDAELAEALHHQLNVQSVQQQSPAPSQPALSGALSWPQAPLKYEPPYKTKSAQ